MVEQRRGIVGEGSVIPNFSKVGRAPKIMLKRQPVEKYHFTFPFFLKK